MRTTNNDRLFSRAQQTQSWAAPLPDFSAMPRATSSPQVRVEWETRDTINNRLWTDIQTSGPKAVTASMLAAHPSHGAETMAPSAARQDQRAWLPAGTATPFFPDLPAARTSTEPQPRPTVPPASLWANPALAGTDIEGGDIARELRHAIKEDVRFRTEDASARILGRTFEHQWIPAVAAQQLAAAELLRPGQDDYQRDFHQARGEMNLPGAALPFYK